MNQATAAPSTRRENLALLYQGLFTGIVRIQSGRQQISNADGFRRRMKEALAEVSREAVKRNYVAEHTMETDFAVVAFLDEVILNSHDPCRNEWAQKPLQEDLFGLSVAGEMFFTRAEKLLARNETPEVADILEVYYLCLLLGFEGKYAVSGGKSELHLVTDRIRHRIAHIRGESGYFSPHGALPEEQVTPIRPDALLVTLKKAAVAAGASALGLLVLFWIHLLWKGTQVHDAVARGLLQ
jgi:type VI secretion system protein ImpK